MLDELLEKKLKDLKGDDILVVMDDGLAFLGELEEYDKNTLVLRCVFQAPSKQIEWRELPSESEEVREQMEEEKRVGFIDWTRINLEELYVRTEHVTRIWRWKRTEKGEGVPTAKKDRKPVYTKGEKVPKERASSMGDIPGTHSR